MKPKQTGWARIKTWDGPLKRVPAYGRSRHFVITPCQEGLPGWYSVTHTRTGYLAVRGVRIRVARRAMTALENLDGVRWTFRDVSAFRPEDGKLAGPVARKFEAMR